MPFPLTLTPVGDDMVRAERVFPAPPAKVWRALSDPDLVRIWMAMPTHPMIACEMDFRVGGQWRYVWKTPSGVEMPAAGVYREIEPGVRIVHTELFDDDWTDGETVCTTVLTPVEAGTRLVMDILYTGQKGRDMALRSGMEHGMSAGYDTLEAMLAG